MTHIYRRRVQFYETDAQGIVHHSNYFRYFEEARGDLLRTLGLPYSKLREEGYEVVLLSAFCEFKKPLFYDEEILIKISLSYIDRFTFSFDYQVFVEEELRAVGNTKHCILKDLKIRSIPNIIRDVLKGSDGKESL
ncbi:acyl-CoA thioesterase [Hydrogenobacter hydrogenophilus]|uniref:Acyl-CoA thioester hydrolase n=1 Tax=Hydrogenobacter hydrogenophilus TaxID=35835 RepID=A0A285P1Z9_9AQUI|nr:thioesterase family protein [Hydrogenobacter hydrogenophilus]SNZ15183.1 acyl-CoA thioester hydrolase [Hydrogenobacter hydrogenophilus]